MAPEALDLLTVAEACAHLRISRDLAYELIRRGEFRICGSRVRRIPALA